MDLFTVPTGTFRVLFCFVILRHDRRRVVHSNHSHHAPIMAVPTEHPVRLVMPGPTSLANRAMSSQSNRVRFS